MVSFTVQKLISLIRSHLFILIFISIALGDWSKKTLVWFMSENVLLVFSSRSFLVSCFIFKTLGHFEFIFMHDVRVCFNFIDLHELSSFSNTTCWRTCLFSILVNMFSKEVLLIKVCTFLDIIHCILSRLQFGVNNFYRHWETKKICVTCFIDVFASLQ